MLEFFIAITILIISTLSITFSRSIYGFWLNPLMIYSLVWGLSFSGYHLDLFNYYTTEPNDSLYVIVFVAWAAFMMGGIFIYFIFKNLQIQKHHFPTENNWLMFLFLNERTIRRICILSSIISFIAGISGLIYLFTHFSVANFVADFARIRNQTGVPGGVGYDDIVYRKSPFLQVIGMGFSLAAVAINSLYVGAYRKNYFFVLLSFIGCIFLSLSELSRARLIDMFLIFFIAFYYGSKLYKRKFSFKPLLIISLLLLIYFVFLSFLGNKTGENIQNFRSPIARVGAVIYTRLTGPVYYLNEYICNNDSELWLGEASFNPAYRFLYAIGFIKSYRGLLNRDPSFINPNWFGAQPPTYLKWFLIDFGMHGIWIMAFLFGCIVSIPYFIIKSKISISSLMFSIIFFPAVCFSYGTWRFADHFFAAEMASAILISFIISALSRKCATVRR